VASLPSHAIAALGIGAFFYKPGIPKRVWVVGAICSLIPDLDVIGFRFGIPYADFWSAIPMTNRQCFTATYRRIRVTAKAATTSFTNHPRE
jgi:hypothetical protein